MGETEATRSTRLLTALEGGALHGVVVMAGLRR
jgi:hypothetical protein